MQKYLNLRAEHVEPRKAHTFVMLQLEHHKLAEERLNKSMLLTSLPITDQYFSHTAVDKTEQTGLPDSEVKHLMWRKYTLFFILMLSIYYLPWVADPIHYKTYCYPLLKYITTESTCGSEGLKFLQKMYEENRSYFWGFLVYFFGGGDGLGIFAGLGVFLVCFWLGFPPGLPGFV